MYTLIILTAMLFVLALLFGKRFGTPVLALAAGLVISGYMSDLLIAVSEPYIHQYIAYVPPALVVLPALLLLLLGKGKHRAVIPRILNAAVFAAAGLVFVIAAPSTPPSLTADFGFITHNVALLVTGLLGFAILEVIFGKSSKKKVDDLKK